MNTIIVPGTLLSLALVISTGTPAAAQQQAGLPTYASHEESVHGRIATIVDRYHLTVNDDRGFVDNVTLRDGTVINPTGLSLAPGQPVTIYGRAEGQTFAATQVDEPEQQADANPYGGDDGDAYAPGPYGPPDPYGYGAYDPYGYGYGYPSIGIGFYGGGGWYGGYGGHRGHGYGGHGNYGGHSGYGGGYGSRGGYGGSRGGYGGYSRGSAGRASSGGGRGAASGGGHGGGRR